MLFYDDIVLMVTYEHQFPGSEKQTLLAHARCARWTLVNPAHYVWPRLAFFNSLLGLLSVTVNDKISIFLHFILQNKPENQF